MAETIENILERELNDIVKAIKNNITTSGKKATGKTQKHITSEVTGSANTALYGFILAPDYIENLETGTPPTKNASFMEANDLADELIDWATAKNIQVDDMEMFLIRTAYKILDFGSHDYRNKIFTNIFSKEIIQAQKEIPKKISSAYVNIFVNTLDQNLNK